MAIRDIDTTTATATINDIFHEQADVALSVNATTGGAVIVNLSTASTRYMLRDFTITTAADPTTETVDVDLIKLVNDVETTVDTFQIDTTNWTQNHDLNDMWGQSDVEGDLIKIKITSSTGTIACVGQYSHAKTT